MKETKLLLCSSGKVLGEQILLRLQDFQCISRLRTDEIWFSNGEMKTILQEDPRGKRVVVFQCLDDSEGRGINDNWMVAMTAVDACWRAKAAEIIVVFPQYPYARQERRVDCMESVSASMLASFMEALPIDEIWTSDIHAPAIEGFFKKTALRSFSFVSWFFKNLRYFSPSLVGDCVLVAPDAGACRTIRMGASLLGLPHCFLHKTRDYQGGGRVETMDFVGEPNMLKGKNILLCDDIVSTGGTLLQACLKLKSLDCGDIFMFSTFPLFNGNAPELFENAYKEGVFSKFFGSDAALKNANFLSQYSWYSQVSMDCFWEQNIRSVLFR